MGCAGHLVDIAGHSRRWDAMLQTPVYPGLTGGKASDYAAVDDPMVLFLPTTSRAAGR